MSWPLIAVMIKAKRITTKEVAVLIIFVFYEESGYVLLLSLPIDLCLPVDLLLLPELLLLSYAHKCHVSNFTKTLAFQRLDII